MKTRYLSWTAALVLLLLLSSCARETAHTFMSYNVHNCIGMDKKTDYSRIGKLILEMDPEVAAIQELDSATARNPHHVLGELARVTGLQATFAPAIDYRGGKYGIGLLSREKPLHSYSVPLPGAEERRTLLVAEFQDYIFCSVHLSLTAIDRMRSMDIIRNTLKGGGKPVFIAGDFNAHPDSPAMEQMNRMGVPLSDTTLASYPSGTPRECIDYIYQLHPSTAFPVLAHGRMEDSLTRTASDHRPVFVKVKF